MLEKLERMLKPNTLLLLRYRIIERERYWSKSVLSPQTEDVTPEIEKDGAIYKAKDVSVKDHERLVTVLERITSDDPEKRSEMLQICQREADFLSSLNHPSIPKLLEYVTPQDRAYLVTDYVGGRDLQVFVNSPDFRWVELKDIVQWIILLCDVIAYLHEQDPPLLYRALEAQKVKVDVTGKVSLTDLSTVSVFRENFRGTLTGVHGFAAPEQYRGEHTPQSDVYTIGALLHYLVTAHSPSTAPPNNSLERSEREATPDLRETLEGIAYKALSFNAEWRFRNARELQKALQEVI